jgi:hypothetical protein
VTAAYASGLGQAGRRRVMSSPTGLVDAADFPLARVDGVIWAVLVDSGAEAGRAELESQIIPHPYSRAPAVFCRT